MECEDCRNIISELHGVLAEARKLAAALTPNANRAIGGATPSADDVIVHLWLTRRGHRPKIMELPKEVLRSTVTRLLDPRQSIDDVLQWLTAQPAGAVITRSSLYRFSQDVRRAFGRLSGHDIAAVASSLTAAPNDAQASEPTAEDILRRLWLKRARHQRKLVSLPRPLLLEPIDRVLDPQQPQITIVRWLAGKTGNKNPAQARAVYRFARDVRDAYAHLTRRSS